MGFGIFSVETWTSGYRVWAPRLRSGVVVVPIIWRLMLLLCNWQDGLNAWVFDTSHACNSVVDCPSRNVSYWKSQLLLMSKGNVLIHSCASCRFRKPLAVVTWIHIGPTAAFWSVLISLLIRGYIAGAGWEQDLSQALSYLYEACPGISCYFLLQGSWLQSYLLVEGASWLAPAMQNTVFTCAILHPMICHLYSIIKFVKLPWFRWPFP